jgi:hypothetical protein
MFRLLVIILAASLTWADQASAQSILAWQREFPKGEFSTSSVPLLEFEYDGNTRDSIPPIYQPTYVPVAQATRYAILSR